MRLEWREVAGYEGLYEVSSDGRVRSVDRVIQHKDGSQTRRNGKNLKPGITPKNYEVVTLSKGCKTKTYLVSRLVAMTFHGPCAEGHECRHLDGNPRNNRVENLAWGTSRQNMADKIAHDRNGFSLSKESVLEIVHMLPSASIPEIAKKFDVRESTIHAIVKRKIWAHLTPKNISSIHHGRGERHYNAKLTNDDVAQIRGMRGTTTQAKVAKQFGVDPSLISRIMRGEYWKSL